MGAVKTFRDKAGKVDDRKVIKRFFTEAIRALGYHHFDAFSVRLDTIDNPDHPENFFLCDYDIEIISHYIGDGWMKMDPSLKKLARTSQPFDYVEYMNTCMPNSSVRWQLRMLKLQNVKHAWLVPQNVANASRGVTCYMRGNGTDHYDHFLNTRHDIQLLASELMGRLEALQMIKGEAVSDVPIFVPEKKVKISPREMDCLHWVAEGKTNSEIGRILALSENTVHFHLKNIFSKLGVNTRSSAVIAATKMGFL